MDDVVKICSDFVKEICKGRDESHGYNHAQAVFLNSMKICIGENIINPRMIKLITITAWLHDVADYKYDTSENLENKVKEFLNMKFRRDSVLIWNIISRISYSKEIKSKKDWKTVLKTKGILIRNIVSDADKLEAIGKVGIERCIHYGIEYHNEHLDEKVPNSVLLRHVNEYAKEKLLGLKDHFIYTATGKRMAEPLHDEMIKELELLNKTLI